MTSPSNLFDIVVFLLSSLVTEPSFMSISLLVLGFGVMTIFVYNRLTRNPEIGNTPSEFWAISGHWTLGQVRYTKFGRNVSNKLLNATKF